ncbi:phytoene desaturase family protein [Tenuifilum thalassicum]|uniref:NAD(P)/FAD-dependent oxidoreductase n=1 Tax=Tenuifilum thalassicum TaxID=2590900 RepID=A0A7D3Y3F4_9BACT|nr:NAD(P)/FAD-dependent oxidoreductase [Tenuifilum thalassicum]QKG79329.1 NAD(P)/FAD-dependent oxidoreductase [Tenuifilum thalassicum]
MDNRMYDVIVVGGGLAGLTAAVYSARKGRNVLLVEKNSKCGGLASSIEHNGFVFDAGAKGLINAGIIKPMVNDLGIDLKLIRSKVSVGIADRIIGIDGLADIESYKNLLLHFFPNCRQEVDIVIREMVAMMRYTKTFYAVDNPEFRDIKKDYKYLFKDLLPWLPSFLYTLLKTSRLMEPMEDYLGKWIQSKPLADMVLQHFFQRMPAFFALGYFYVFLDYWYPVGGVGKLGEALLQKYKELNGKLAFSTRIVKVIPSENQLIDEKGNAYGYDKLIWTADLKSFYGIVYPDGLSNEQKSKFDKTKFSVTKAATGDSVFQLFLEVDERPETYSQFTNPHLLYTPMTDGLGDSVRTDFAMLIANWSQANKAEVVEWVRNFVKRNTFEISFPVLRDSNLAPEGKTGIIVNFFTDYRIFQFAQNDGWVDELTGAFENALIDTLSKSIFPNLKEKLIHKFSFTPLSIKEWAGSSGGAITGWAFGQELPVVNKMIKVQKSVRTPFPNIFQAGQWAYSPSGIPMSILTGKIASNFV